jgi:hypothetical protein
LRQRGQGHAFVVGEDGRWQGGVSLEGLLRGLESGSSRLQSLYLEGIAPVSASLSLNALIGRIVQKPVPLPVLAVI